MPAVTYADMYDYFVVRKSCYTHSQFRAYKALDSFDLFASGWVKNVRCKQVQDDIVLATSNVSIQLTNGVKLSKIIYMCPHK